MSINNLNQQLENACIRGDTDDIRQLVRQCSDFLINGPGLQSGLCPAIIVSERHSGTLCYDILEVLWKHGANIPSAVDPRNRASILHNVVERSGPQSITDLVQWLLQIGCHPMEINQDGVTPIDMARRKGNHDLVLLMKQSMEPEYNQENGQQKPEENTNKPTKKEPEKSSNKIINKSKNDMKTKEIKEEENKELEAENSVTQVDKDEFIDSIINGDLKSIKKLLDKKIDVNMESDLKYRPVHYAVSKNQLNSLDILKLLDEYKADFNALTEENDNVLNLAVKKVKEEENLIEIVNFLLSKKVDKSQTDKDGHNAHDIARLRRLNDIMNLLFDVNSFEGSYHKIHSICKATKITSEDKIKMLEKEFFQHKGHNRNLKSKEEEDTCLIIACRKEDEVLVKYLLEKNSTVDILNKAGETPLSITRQDTKNRIIEEMLLEADKRQKALLNWQKVKRRRCIIL